MVYDIQKAGILRRISAGLFDIILLVVLACGIAWGISAIIDIDSQIQAMDAVYEKYETEYGIDFTITEEQMATMPEEEIKKYNETIEILNNDEEASLVYSRIINSFLVMISLSALISHLLLEFLIPVLLKNGQTMGKKIFGIALMRKDGVAVSTFAMFVRSILGKCTLETMTPILSLVMMFLGISGLIGPFIPLALLVAQLALLLFHRHNAVLHDLLACTVAVDMASQRIFPTVEALEEYQKQQAAERAQRADY